MIRRQISLLIPLYLLLLQFSATSSSLELATSLSKVKAIYSDSKWVGEQTNFDYSLEAQFEKDLSISSELLLVSPHFSIGEIFNEQPIQMLSGDIYRKHLSLKGGSEEIVSSPAGSDRYSLLMTIPFHSYTLYPFVTVRWKEQRGYLVEGVVSQSHTLSLGISWLHTVQEKKIEEAIIEWNRRVLSQGISTYLYWTSSFDTPLYLSVLLTTTLSDSFFPSIGNIIYLSCENGRNQSYLVELTYFPTRRTYWEQKSNELVENSDYRALFQSSYVQDRFTLETQFFYRLERKAPFAAYYQGYEKRGEWKVSCSQFFFEHTSSFTVLEKGKKRSLKMFTFGFSFSVGDATVEPQLTVTVEEKKWKTKAEIKIENSHFQLLLAISDRGKVSTSVTMNKMINTLPIALKISYKGNSTFTLGVTIDR